MTCDTIQGRLTALLDGELPPETAAETERHLASCPVCAQARAELRAVRELALVWPVDPADITARVMAAVALGDQSLFIDDLRRLRDEMQELRAEVAALRRQLSQPMGAPAWFPQAAPDYSRLENDPWNLIRS